jgi:hypothetical protein
VLGCRARYDDGGDYDNNNKNNNNNKALVLSLYPQKC